MSTIKELAGSSQVLANGNGASATNGQIKAAGTDLDNTTELAFAYDFELNCGFGSSVSAGQPIDLYIVPKLDGTDAADIDTSTPTAQASHYRGTFTTASTGTTARRLTLEGVPLGPYKYTAYVYNRSGQTISANWSLTAYPVKAQAV